MPFIRSISGLRATAGDSLTPEIICKYSAAFAEFLPPGPVVLGRDGRKSGEWIEMLVAGTLAACGRRIRLISLAPTPTVQLTVEHSDAAGGIAVTASHNPAEWNGLKFLNSEGVFLDKDENEKFWKIVDSGNYSYSPEVEDDNIKNDASAVDRHIKRILDLPLFNGEIIDKIRNRNLTAVVDAVNASGSFAVPQLLEALGCKVIKLYCDGKGNFPHTPEPLPENLSDLSMEVAKTGADIGIAVDPDADRLVLIDEKGNPPGEERTIVLSALSALSSGIYPKGSNVVVNQSTTRAVEDVAEKFGAVCSRSAVGEINVVKKMKETEAVIGGEGSGGVILPDCHYGRDSLVGTALIIRLLAVEEKKLSEINSGLPNYSMLKTKREFSGGIGELLDKIESEFPDAQIERGDGIKINFEKSWVQLRASNTEPIIRIISEAPEKSEAKALSAIIFTLIAK